MINKYYILLLILSIANNLMGATIYVSTTGDDSNIGTISAPFSSFSKAISVMKAGDTCIIRGGVYREKLIINKSGNAANYLTFKAAEGEEVVINATTVINNWELYKGNIFKSTVNVDMPSRYRAVYHYGDYLDLARWPNNDDDGRWTLDCEPVLGGDASTFEVKKLPNTDLTGASVYYIGAHSGTSWTRKITSNNTNTINFTAVDINKWPFRPHNPTIWRNYYDNNRGQLYVYNNIELLDHAREWYYDETSKTLYLHTADGKIPSDGSVEYASHRSIAELKGKYITLEGITFFGGSIKIKNKADYNKILNCKVVHGSEVFDTFTNVTTSLDDASILVLGDNTLVKGCEINHSTANGISIPKWAAPNCVIEGNTISNSNYLGIHASALRTNADNIKIIKNRIFNAGRDGMFVASINSEIAYNDVSHSQKINGDSGIFYTVGTKKLKNTEIHHNWFHDAEAPRYSYGPRDPAKAAGIYLDNDSKGYTIHHNVVWNVSWSAIQINWNNVNLNFYHNTLLNAATAMDAWPNGRKQPNNKIYNNYANTGAWYEGAGPEEFKIKNSPIFSESPLEDAENLNFIPVETSPLVDKGIIIPGFSKAFLGSAADIGAYERGGIAWTAGVDAVEDVRVITKPTITINSKPKFINFDDFSNPLKIISDDKFKISIDGLYPDKKYVLHSRIVNQRGEVLFFNKSNAQDTNSKSVTINWRSFANNPAVINSTDKFEWKNIMYVEGDGVQDEKNISDLSIDKGLRLNFRLEDKDIKVYPNPTKGFVNVEGLGNLNASYIIVDSTGKKVRHFANFKGLPSGVYMLEIITKHNVFTKKVVKH